MKDKSVIEILATIIILVIIGLIVYSMISYVDNGQQDEYENNLERCMLIYKDYEYCKYRSY